ncbi:MAG: hypothetical protein KA994_07240, partial [Brachymonas sp.]|nr:hypothetical protein [Brachymonas sp.]
WIAFLIITLVFTFPTAINIIEQPSGIKIASLFIFAIIFASFMRPWRSVVLLIFFAYSSMKEVLIYCSFA